MASTNSFSSLLFGRDLVPDRVRNLLNFFPPMPYSGYVPRPTTHAAVHSSSESEVKNEKNQFQVMLNVGHFVPNEIEVKVVENYIVVHGKHEEITDEHGFVQREFTRRYMLPEGIEADTVKSSWSTNGVLTIEAPNKAIEAPASNERVVPISLSFTTSEKEVSG